VLYVGENPIISVIVPVYNVDKYLNQCIDSILNQTFSNFELILVNDGSFDYSYKICKEYAEKDSRVRVFSQENKGAGSARNKGIDESKGEYLTFIDSDDYVVADYLEKLYHAIVEYNVSIAMTAYYRYDDSNNMLYYYLRDEDYGSEMIPQNELFNRMLDDANYLQVCAKIYRKTLFDDVRFPVNRYFEDFYTVTKLFVLTPEIVFVKDNLYCYRRHPNSIVNTPVNLKKVIDHIEGYEETILLLALYKADISGFINKYRSYLQYYKEMFEDKQIVDIDIYHKIVSRLDIIEEKNE